MGLNLLHKEHWMSLCWFVEFIFGLQANGFHFQLRICRICSRCSVNINCCKVFHCMEETFYPLEFCAKALQVVGVVRISNKLWYAILGNLMLLCGLWFGEYDTGGS
eukprot:TRINITY_DN878_c0_g1_i14.p1 TRINITY_DN878_c0_g1~~TRINITY_DN878_c0_g1_i14.p1  ORF type:complete len:106 (+),score=1.75 TRINITY_DN878_c0_g1_i14:2708-3025(+)